jgi:N-acyl homoserine lactone hydrolase
MGLSILPLRAGYVAGIETPKITYMRGWKCTHDSPFIIFVIEGGAAPIVVDTGPPEAERVLARHNFVMVQAPEEEPSQLLSAAGIGLADVRIVVNTHLHWDHCSNNRLFPNAKFVVQKRELEYAVDPLAWHNAGYGRGPGIEPPWFSVWDRIETVDGDAEVAPGVSVVALPGHTPGSQGVVVDTDAGRFLIAGDCVNTYKNWLGDETAEHIPSGIFTNLIEYDQSFRKIESLGCEVIPSHDEAVLDRGRVG